VKETWLVFVSCFMFIFHCVSVCNYVTVGKLFYTVLFSLYVKHLEHLCCIMCAMKKNLYGAVISFSFFGHYQVHSKKKKTQ